MKAKNVCNGEVIELKWKSNRSFGTQCFVNEPIEDFEDEIGIEEIMLIGKGQTRNNHGFLIYFLNKNSVLKTIFIDGVNKHSAQDEDRDYKYH